MIDLRPVLATAAFLAATACSDRPQSSLDEDSVAILKAVLEHQEDIPAEWDRYYATNPGEEFWGNRLFDRRMCVEREVAASADEFDRYKMQVRTGANEPGFSPTENFELWEASKNRSVLPTSILPAHLVWDGPFNLCSSGVLWLSHPVVNGDEATIFLQNECSGWCGWGGLLQLKRSKKGWEIGEFSQYWVS